MLCYVMLSYVMQVQLSLLDRRPEASGLSAYCAEKRIAVLAYGVLAGGLLSDRYLHAPPPPADPASHETRSITKYLLIIDEAGGWDRFQALLRALRAIADRAGEGVSIASLALAWVLSRHAVGAAIIGARGQSKIACTIAGAQQRISAQLLDECTAAADTTLRPVPGEVYELEREREGPHGRIMRYNLQAMSGTPYVLELEERLEAAVAALEEQRAAAAQCREAHASFAARRVAARRFREQAAAIGAEAVALKARSTAADVAQRAQKVASDVERLREMVSVDGLGCSGQL